MNVKIEIGRHFMDKRCGEYIDSDSYGNPVVDFWYWKVGAVGYWHGEDITVSSDDYDLILKSKRDAKSSLIGFLTGVHVAVHDTILNEHRTGNWEIPDDYISVVEKL